MTMIMRQTNLPEIYDDRPLGPRASAEARRRSWLWVDRKSVV